MLGSGGSGSSPLLASGCQNCGEAVQSHWRLCPVCGHRLETRREPRKASRGKEEAERSSVHEFELIAAEDVEWGDKLGEGSYGVVFKGTVK